MSYTQAETLGSGAVLQRAVGFGWQRGASLAVPRSSPQIVGEHGAPSATDSHGDAVTLLLREGWVSDGPSVPCQTPGA